MNPTRRWFVSFSALCASAAAVGAHAQFGGRSRGDSGSMRSSRAATGTSRGAAPRLGDPVVAVERELPSLRIDLKLTADQEPLFDSFERQLRNAAENGRLRDGHILAFRSDDGSTVTADAVLGTLASDDAQCADAMRLADERMKALYAILTEEQRKQFDRRIVQSLRDPLGTS
jgi:hypothetical protein